MQITPTGELLGARVEGIDLAQPLSVTDFEALRKPWRLSVCCASLTRI